MVSFVDAAFGGLSWRDAAAYLPAKVAGCIGGAVLANLMFALPAVSISTKRRATPAHFLSEVIATLGLIVVIFALVRSGRSRSAPAAVGAYIGAAAGPACSCLFLRWILRIEREPQPASTYGGRLGRAAAGLASGAFSGKATASIFAGWCRRRSREKQS